jgi:hypothetical protein
MNFLMNCNVRTFVDSRRMCRNFEEDSFRSLNSLEMLEEAVCIDPFTEFPGAVGPKTAPR